MTVNQRGNAEKHTRGILVPWTALAKSGEAPFAGKPACLPFWGTGAA